MITITIRSLQKRFTLTGLVFSVSFLLFLLSMSRDVNIYDEALILVGATLVSDGAVLHRDFYTNYGPAQFYALAGLFKIFGTSVLVERIWDTVIRASIVAVSFLLVKRTASWQAGLLCTALVTSWLCAFQNYAFPVFPALLFALLAALLLIPLFEGKQSRWMIFGSGCCIGITTLFRYDVGFYAFAALTIVTTAFLLKENAPPTTRFTHLLRNLIPLWLGVVFVSLPVAAAYTVSGTIPDFMFDIVYYPVHFYRRMRGLPFPSLHDVIQRPRLSGIYFTPLVLIAAFFVFASDRKSFHARLGASTPRFWIIILLIFLSAFFYLKGMVRVSTIHMALSIVPALMLVSILVIHLDRRHFSSFSQAARLFLFAILTIIIIGTGLITLDNARTAKLNINWARQSSTWIAATVETPAAVASCRPTPSLERAACFFVDQPLTDAVNYVKANSHAHDTIYVGLRHHDRVFINNILFYFLTDLRPATKWHHFDPGLQNSEEIQLKIIQELRLKKPRHVVTEARWENISEPNESSTNSGVTLLDDFIRSNYHAVKTFDKTVILKANEG